MNVHALLKKYFGYDTFRPLQEEIIREAIHKKDTLVLMPTGGGKSVCYQLPALETEGITLVISPLISLMKDQVDALKSNGIQAEYLNSSLTFQGEQKVIEQCLEGNVRLLYLSPEKALALLNSFITGMKINLIAIDEAHCVSQWGHDFRPEYRELKKLREKFPNTPMMALTATADKLTRQDILSQLGLINPAEFISSFDRANISLAVKYGMSKREKLRDIQGFISKRPEQSGIIYCTSRASTESLAEELKALGISAKCYHAGMDSKTRSRVQEEFINDTIQVVCATIAFGMGIDKSNVRFVLHYNLPKSIESYYQEIGRGGRDGMPCDTILFYSLGDLIMLRTFAKDSGQPEINIEKLTRMQEYAEARICRRKILLNYFGENMRDNCNNCDVCGNPPRYFDGSVVSQKALSALVRIEASGEKVGSHLLADVLRGLKHKEIFERKLNTIKTYGAGTEYSAREWLAYILQMVQLGMIDIAYDDGNVLRVTPFGQSVLKGEYKPQFVEVDKADGIRTTTIGRKSAMQSGPDLFSELRGLRREIAFEKNVPPYIIFHDSSLQEMVNQLPRNREEMIHIPGVSEVKMQQYGQRFLDKIIAYSQVTNRAPEISVEETLSEPNLLAYMKELKEKNMTLSHTVVGKVLLGSERKSVSDKHTELSFYGRLKYKTTYKAIGKRLKEFYAPYIEKENEGSKYVRTAEDEEKATLSFAFFSGETVNRLSEASRKELEEKISGIPFAKPTDQVTSEYILQNRKTYPRFMEPWGKEEIIMLERCLEYTNDAEYLGRAFGRNTNSIRAMTGSILLRKTERVEETRKEKEKMEKE